MSDNYIELGELVSISESKAYRNLIGVRKEYLQDRINHHVKNKEWYEAFGALSKLEDVDKQIDIVNNRILEIRKEKSNG